MVKLRRNQVAGTLQKNAEQLSQAITLSPDSVVISRFDDGTILDVNESFLRVTGYTRREVVGKTTVEIEIWANAADRELAAKQLRESGEYIGLETAFRAKGGRIIPALISARLIQIEGQSCVVSLTRDISKLKESEEALRKAKDELEDRVQERTGELSKANEALTREIEEREKAETDLLLFKAIVELSGEAIGISDPAGRLIYVNPAHEKLFGRPLEEARKLNYRDYYPPESVEILNTEAAPALMKGESWGGVLDAFDARGRRFALWERADTVSDSEGRMLYGFGLMHDITEEKAAERALHRRDEILNALAQSTKRFLEAPFHQEPIKEMLGRLGEATGVSRVYVFENQINDQGVLVTSERQEWVGPGVKSHAENLDTQNFPWVSRGMERWARALSRGEAIQGLREDFPASEQWLLVAQDIQSILIVPIFVEQKWWGFIGFDDCESQRLWSAAETDALTVAAGGLGALLQRSQADGRLRQHAFELKERVKEINCLLSISSLAESPEVSGDVFQGIVDLIPPGWQFPEITCARITVEGEEYRTSNFSETIWRQSSAIRLFGQQVGTVEVCCLSEKPGGDQGPFLREETELLNAVARILARLIERKRSSQRIQSLSQELVRVRESERQKISQDLHDHLAQDLASIKLGIKDIVGDLTHLSDAKRQKAAVLSQLIEQSVDFIRKMTYELHPHGLEDLGLVETIRLYCEEFAARTGTKVDFFSAGMQPIDLEFDEEISLYRIVQEGLSNIQKHAAASRVTIRLSASFPFIMLQIEDNGRGFDVESCLENALKERRMGLRIMEQRVALLKGKMVIGSRVGSGSKIRITIPYGEVSDG